MDKTKNKNIFEILKEICDFPIPTYEEWRKVTEKSLKGVAFEKLLTKTYEGIILEPIYRNENMKGITHLSSLPGNAPYIRGTKAVLNKEKAWEVNQEISERLPEQFNKVVKHDLGKGQTSLNIVLDKPSFEGHDVDDIKELFLEKEGVSISSLPDLRQAIANIDLTKVPLYVHAGAVSLPFLSLVMAYLEEKNIATEDLKGCIGMDPLGVLVSNGEIGYGLNNSYDAMAMVTKWVAKNDSKLQTIMVEGHPYHNGGGNAVQELAFSLSTAVEYIQAMLERGLTIDEITPKIRFSFSIGANMFMEIAKLRAARLLWSTIVEAFGGNEAYQKMSIHARTSAWTKTIYDPYVNMLRGTAEAFAGAVGGADSMHVSPFDEAIQPSTSFSRRIARNTQIILQEEAHLSKQVDPSGGAWYVELLTDSIARKAWELFQEVESKGGAFKALQVGFPQQKVAETRAERADNIDHRKDVFVGVNKYPNAGEKNLETAQNNAVEDFETRKKALESHRSLRKQSLEINVKSVDQAVSSVKNGATISDVAKAIGRVAKSRLTVEAIRNERGSERFEQLREKADAHFAETGKRQQVFLANLGSVPEHKARADFSAGFFEVGGFEVLQNHGFDRAEEAAKAALESKAGIVVICGTDESYKNQVPELLAKIKDAHPSVTVLLAGKPSADNQTTYKNVGIDDFIHMRSNCYQILVKLQNEKGVKRHAKA